MAQSLHRGGGELIELSLAAVAATYAALPLESSESSTPIAPPQPPPPSPAAPPLGADNAAVRHIVAERLCASC
ncbi:hypothetical protein MYXE_46630 [Mycobacterium xenopi]|uniref:Uncharacterized protein n=1 Tax=Mycobacterium xenopi TaxID=1789 RepID=A0AAD1H541_MYCXE|nr:hypothetical protein MYXE_46630 [Mycobacterium xenopi]